MDSELPFYEKRIVYQVPGMDDVTVQRDLVYSKVGGTDLKMDVYSPKYLSDDTPVPGVLFIHGGPISADLPSPKDWQMFVSYGELVAASGFVGVTFDHRYYGPAYLRQSIGDVLAAIRYIREHATSLNLAPDRFCLWAFSGGGPHLSPFLRDKHDFVRCMVAYYTVLDIRQWSRAAEILGKDALQELSPVTYVGPDAAVDAPILVVRAGLDDPGLNQGIDLFVRNALAANVALDLVNHPQGHHGFDIADDNARSRHIIARTIEFIKDSV